MPSLNNDPNEVAAKVQPTSIFDQITPDATQTIDRGWKIVDVFKNASAHGYLRTYPNGNVDAFKIRGPGGTGITWTQRGQLIFHSGPRTKSKGKGSGNIGMKADGFLGFKGERGIVIDAGKKDPDDSDGLDINVWGDSVEEVVGTKMITAEKIILDASNIEIRGQGIQLVTGDAGGGSLTIAAGDVEEYYTNKSTTRFGQKRVISLGEDSKHELDPRGSTNTVGVGAGNEKYLGDWRVETAGVAKIGIAGGPGQLVKLRTNGLAMNVLAGNIKIDSTAGKTVLSSKLEAKVTGSIVNIEALTGLMNLKSSGPLTISGTPINLN